MAMILRTPVVIYIRFIFNIVQLEGSHFSFLIIELKFKDHNISLSEKLTTEIWPKYASRFLLTYDLISSFRNLSLSTLATYDNHEPTARLLLHPPRTKWQTWYLCYFDGRKC